MSFSLIQTKYHDFEVYELNKFQLEILQAIHQNKDSLKLFIKIVDILNNEMYGHYVMINNHMEYHMDIKLKHQTKYYYVSKENQTYRLEAQQQDDQRYRIQPLVDTVNYVFSKLNLIYTYQFYNIYIRRIKTIDPSYNKRALHKQIRMILQYT